MFILGGQGQGSTQDGVSPLGLVMNSCDTQLGMSPFPGPWSTSVPTLLVPGVCECYFTWKPGSCWQIQSEKATVYGDAPCQ